MLTVCSSQIGFIACFDSKVHKRFAKQRETKLKNRLALAVLDEVVLETARRSGSFPTINTKGGSICESGGYFPHNANCSYLKSAIYIATTRVGAARPEGDRGVPSLFSAIGRALRGVSAESPGPS
ncbi:MAG: hypothetical protein WCD23_04170, partial [Candidatus Acidiferrales bacterium]